MSSQVERWYHFNDRNELIEVSENDGYAYLRDGPQRQEQVIAKDHPRYEEFRQKALK